MPMPTRGPEFDPHRHDMNIANEHRGPGSQKPADDVLARAKTQFYEHIPLSLILFYRHISLPMTLVLKADFSNHDLCFYKHIPLTRTVFLWAHFFNPGPF